MAKKTVDERALGRNLSHAAQQRSSLTYEQAVLSQALARLQEKLACVDATIEVVSGDVMVVRDERPVHDDGPPRWCERSRVARSASVRNRIKRRREQLKHSQDRRSARKMKQRLLEADLTLLLMPRRKDRHTFLEAEAECVRVITLAACADPELVARSLNGELHE